VIAVEYVEVPTFREEPWERDRRAIEDRERHRLRSAGGDRRPPGPGLELSVGGSEKARGVRRRRRWWRLPSFPHEQRMAWIVFVSFLLGELVAGRSLHSVLWFW
jgi:hypothetical protein